MLRDKSLWEASSSGYEQQGYPKKAIDNVVITADDAQAVFHSPLNPPFTFPYLQVKLEKLHWVNSLRIFYRPNAALMDRYVQFKKSNPLAIYKNQI